MRIPLQRRYVRLSYPPLDLCLLQLVVASSAFPIDVLQERVEVELLVEVLHVLQVRLVRLGVDLATALQDLCVVESVSVARLVLVSFRR